MFTRLALISTLFLTLFGWAAESQATVKVGPRYDWFYDNGNFHAVAGGAGMWIETIDAQEAYYFKQSDRNETFVELFDATRNLYVRLYGQSMSLRGPGETQFSFFRAGHWDDRRLYNYTLPGAQPAYLNLKTAEIWHWVRTGAQIHYLREILRNDDQVQLYDGMDQMTISLMDNEIWLKKDGFNWFKYSAGSWN